MGKIFIAALATLSLSVAAQATTFHVATNGSDANRGTEAAPFRTIQHAANLAQPGDVITVHEGIYRERVSPPRGGTSDANRIVYQAAPGEKPVITGAESVGNWVKVRADVWKTTIPNTFFGAFNPYSDLIHGDWFNPPVSPRSLWNPSPSRKRGTTCRPCCATRTCTGGYIRSMGWTGQSCPVADGFIPANI